MDLSLQGHLQPKDIKNNEKLISEHLENNEQTKSSDVIQMIMPGDHLLGHNFPEDSSLSETIKFTDVNNATIDNTDRQSDISGRGKMMTSYDDKVYPLDKNDDYDNESLDDKKIRNARLDETTEMLLTARSSDLEDTDTTAEESSETWDNSSDNGEDACSEGGADSDDDRIDALNDTMDSFESSARQWQTSAIKLGMAIFHKPATNWKSCVSLAEGKVGIKLQRNKIQDSFSVKKISSNSFSFHSNLTLHSEDPMFEQKVAVLEEVQNKQNKDIHSCDMCPREFTKANQLKLHMKTHTGAIKPFKCDDCSRRFFVSLDLTEPFSPVFQKEILDAASPGPSSYPGFYDISGPMPRVVASSTVKLGKDFYCVGNLLGEGGFAKVYSAYWDQGPEGSQDAVLKVQLGGSPTWEWYITNQVHWRIGASSHPSLGPGSAWLAGLMQTPACYVFNSGHILVSQHQHNGTLLDVVNLLKEVDKKVIMDVAEPLAIYLIAELLGLVEFLHSVDIVHADIKPDNFLVRFIPNGSNEQESPCLQLIDFGKSLDLRLLPPNTVFDEVLMESDLLKCVEMREGRPWMHHIDYFGVAGVAYCLLFGGYMNTNIVKIGGRWGIKGAAYKRWWQVDWKLFFDDLLNIKGAGKECLPSLVEWRSKLLAVFKEKAMAAQMEQLKEVLETARRGRVVLEQLQGKPPAKKRKKK